MPSTPNSPFPVTHRTTLHKGAKFDYEEVTWTGDGGVAVTRQFVRHGGAVVIVPVLERAGPQGTTREVVLIRSRRMSIPADLWELPAGTREHEEDPRECAARELEEETGFSASTIEPLGTFHTSPGMTNELMHAFVATGLTSVGQRLEADEGITAHPMPVADVWRLVDRGEIMDAKTLAALLLAQRRGFI